MTKAQIKEFGYINFVPVDYCAIYPGFIKLLMWDGLQTSKDIIESTPEKDIDLDSIWVSGSFFVKLTLPERYFMPQSASYLGKGYYEVDNTVFALEPEFFTCGTVRMINSLRARDDTMSNIANFCSGAVADIPLIMSKTYRFNVTIIFKHSHKYYVEIFSNGLTIKTFITEEQKHKYFYL